MGGTTDATQAMGHHWTGILVTLRCHDPNRAPSVCVLPRTARALMHAVTHSVSPFPPVSPTAHPHTHLRTVTLQHTPLIFILRSRFDG